MQTSSPQHTQTPPLKKSDVASLIHALTLLVVMIRLHEETLKKTQSTLQNVHKNTTQTHHHGKHHKKTDTTTPTPSAFPTITYQSIPQLREIAEGKFSHSNDILPTHRAIELIQQDNKCWEILRKSIELMQSHELKIAILTLDCLDAKKSALLSFFISSALIKLTPLHLTGMYKLACNIIIAYFQFMLFKHAKKSAINHICSARIPEPPSDKAIAVIIKRLKNFEKSSSEPKQLTTTACSLPAKTKHTSSLPFLIQKTKTRTCLKTTPFSPCEEKFTQVKEPSRCLNLQEMKKRLERALHYLPKNQQSSSLKDRIDYHLLKPINIHTTLTLLNEAEKLHQKNDRTASHVPEKMTRQGHLETKTKQPEPSPGSLGDLLHEKPGSSQEITTTCHYTLFHNSILNIDGLTTLLHKLTNLSQDIVVYGIGSAFKGSHINFNHHESHRHHIPNDIDLCLVVTDTASTKIPDIINELKRVIANLSTRKSQPTSDHYIGSDRQTLTFCDFHVRQGGKTYQIPIDITVIDSSGYDKLYATTWDQSAHIISTDKHSLVLEHVTSQQFTLSQFITFTLQPTNSSDWFHYFKEILHAPAFDDKDKMTVQLTDSEHPIFILAVKRLKGLSPQEELLQKFPTFLLKHWHGSYQAYSISVLLSMTSIHEYQTKLGIDPALLRNTVNHDSSSIPGP